MTDEEFATVTDTFKENKDEIIRIVEQCESLDKIHKNTSIKFIKQFYNIIEKDQQQAKSTIIKDCDNK